jgi:hypothetical protein
VEAPHTIVTIDHGLVRIPSELQSDPRFQDGARLQLVPVDAQTRDVPDVTRDWRELDGILAGADFDTTAWKREEREFELAHEERKFGSSRKI